MKSWFEEAQKQYAQKWVHEVRECMLNELKNKSAVIKDKEDSTMRVSYKGFTGDLIRLERVDVSCTCNAHPYKWELDIWSNEKGCKVSFPGVSLKDVKFLGGEVTYG